MQTRRSNRLKLQKVEVETTAAVDAGSEASEAVEGDDSDVELGTKRKRPRKTNKKRAGKEVQKVAGRRGWLRQLPEMPLDLLFDIFGHLAPLDLLHLARTTKALRGMLMQRSAISLWKEALLNVEGLPPCPEDLNEPQYASLAFESYCHFCLAHSVHSVLWALRKRSCQKCLDVHFYTNQTLPNAYELTRLNGPLLPYASSKSGYSELSVYLSSDPCDKFLKGYKSIFFKAEADMLSQQLDELGTDQAKLKKFSEKRKGMVSNLDSHAELCEEWRSVRCDARSQELAQLRNSRILAVYDRLSNLGWEKELKYLEDSDYGSLSDHSLVKVAKALTERVWQSIQAPLIEYLEKIRVERLDAESRERQKQRYEALVVAFKTYVNSRPPNEMILPLGDLYLMDDLQAFIKDSGPEVEITSLSFAGYLARIPELTQGWRLSKDRELLAVMSHDGPNRCTAQEIAKFDQVDDFSTLHLANTFFACQQCHGIISYPRILIHSCMSTAGYNDGPLNSLAWSVVRTKLRRHNGAFDAASSVLECLGMSPLTTRAQELDELDPWLECAPCTHEENGRFVVCGWRKAVYHACNWSHANSDTPSKLIPLTDVDKSQAEKQAATMNTAKPVYFSETLRCLRCRDNPRTTVAKHMSERHGIIDPTDDDFYKSIDVSLCQAPYVVRIPHALSKPAVVSPEVGVPDMSTVTGAT